MSDELTKDGFAREEEVDTRSSLEKRLDRIMPSNAEEETKTTKNDKEYIKLTKERYAEQTRELLHENPDVDIEGIVEHFGGKVPDDIKGELVKILAENNPQRATNYKEAVEQTILEDKLLKAKTTKREDRAFGKTSEGEPRRLETVDKKFIDNIMDLVWRFIDPQDIKKELLVKKRIKNITNVLLDERTYSKYRYRFISDEYKNIIGGLPKVIITEWGEGYIREALMVLHTLYKFGRATETLDPLTIAEAIVERNEVLPGQLMYDKPFTVEFFMDLADYNVFKKIQKLCNDEILINQLVDLTTTVSKNISELRAQDSTDPKTLKDLTDLLAKIQGMSEALNASIEVETISYVFNDSAPNMDYAELGYFNVIDPLEKRSFNFKYYITCYDEDVDGNEIFKGYITYSQVKKKYVSNMDDIHLFEVVNGDTDAEKKLRKLIRDLRENGEHKKYVVNKLVNEEHVLKEEV